jgi:hypothetical protein
MTYEYVGNTIPAPGLNINTPSTTDQELKNSTVGYSQRGGQVAAGQGVLPLGTILARNTVDKLWYKYTSGGSNGTDVAAGVLRTTVDTGTGSGGSGFLVNIAFKGTLKYNLVSSANTTNLAAGITSLGAHTNIPLNQFSF